MISDDDYEAIHQLNEVYGKVRIRNLFDIPLEEVVDRITKKEGADAMVRAYSAYSLYQPELYQALQARLDPEVWEVIAPRLCEVDLDRRRKASEGRGFAVELQLGRMRIRLSLHLLHGIKGSIC